MKVNRVPSFCDLHFEAPITLWDEAIPLGSGLTGCLIYGDGAPLKLSLDRGDLWDCRPAPEVLAEDYTYAELIRLVREGKQEEILRRFDEFYETCTTPTKLPAGKLQLIYDAPQTVKSHLSLQRAEATVTVETGDGTSEISVFLSAETKFGYLKIKGVTPDAEFLPHDFTPLKKEEPYSLNGNSTRKLGYPAATSLESGSVRGIVQQTGDGAFALLYGESKTETGKEAVFYVASSRDGETWLDDAVDCLEQALVEGYDAAIIPHLEWWESFWNKSALTVPDKVLEKNWYLANYYLGSCSRKGGLPMPLQGVWTADNGCLPPWKGDFHGDLNLQFSYYSALKADHLEEFGAFSDFFVALSETAGRKFARDFFDAPGGSCLPSVFALDGTSLGGWPMYATNIVNQIWELHVLYQYYRYTEDETFKENTLIPLLTECEIVVRRWLTEDEKGGLTLPLSSSPEINNNDLKAWLPCISNYDLALVRFLYHSLIEFTDDAEYREILSRLPDYAADETGYQIYKGCPLAQSHRHHSHMMQAYPLDLIDWSDEKDRKTVRDSLDHLRELGSDWWVGFSFTWLADLEARMGHGENAAKALRNFTDCLCSVNGFHLNGDLRQTGLTRFDSPKYRPFTLESNMMLAEALQEMLMQCYDGVIRVFPAVPADWMQDCSFDGLLAFGNVKVSAVAKDGAVQRVTVTARKDGGVKVYNPFTGVVESYEMRKGETTVLSR